LIKVSGKLDSDVVDAKIFNPKENSIKNKQISIFRKLSSTEIKYINFEAELLLLINSQKTHLLHINVEEDTMREIPIREDIGKNPSMCGITNQIVIFIGGLNSDYVFILDVKSSSFDFVGRMSSVRYGAYIIKYNQYVYICGGVNQDNDNSLEVEYFNLQTHYELKTVKFNNSYLLRKINPLSLVLGSGETFLVSGGQCLFDNTDTSCFVDPDKMNAQISNISLPKPFSSFNPNTLFYKGIYYFFGEDEENELYEFSQITNTFTRIKKEDLNFN
jgi:hypothetical protein